MPRCSGSRSRVVQLIHLIGSILAVPLFLIFLIACSLVETASPLIGLWGGSAARFEVESDWASLHLPCMDVALSGAIVLEGGRFAIDALASRNPGARPSADVTPPEPQRLRLAGSVEGDAMTLTARDARGIEVWSGVLTRNAIVEVPQCI